MAKTKKRASGPTQPEDERRAQQKLLRLTPSEIADLDARAEEAGQGETTMATDGSQ